MSKNKNWHSKAQELYLEGYSYRAIGRELGKDESVVRRYLNKEKPSRILQSIQETVQDLKEVLGLGSKQQELMDAPVDQLIYGGVKIGSVGIGTPVLFDPELNDFTVNGVPLKDKGISAFGVQSNTFSQRKLKIAMVADTQCKDGVSLAYMSAIGKYLAEKQPDVIVHIGDNWDCPSLSSYDKGKKSFEGRRLKLDIDAGNRGLELLMNPIGAVSGYNPRLVFCTGNHEERLDRVAENTPEFSGFIGTEILPLSNWGWEVVPFLKPIEIGGIFFCHYFTNEFTGKPLTGSALNILKTLGRSFCAGHKQVLDFATRPLIDGSQQIGIINGACYDFDEGYKGVHNNHFRGLTMLHEVENGFGTPMFVSLQYMKDKYGK